MGTPSPTPSPRMGRPCRLIGAGIRNKWMFNVYVGALYAEKPTFNAANLIKSEQINGWTSTCCGMGILQAPLSFA